MQIDWLPDAGAKTDGPKGKVAVSVPSLDDLLSDLKDHFERRQGFGLATLNLDHVVKLRDDPAFGVAYLAHSHVTADGNPIVWLSRIAGAPVDLLPGADLIAPLCNLAATTKTRVALLGSTDETLTAAASALMARHPGLEVALCISPPMGFDPSGPLADTYISRLDDADIGLCFLALGAPKQELFAAHAVTKTDRVGFVAIGSEYDGAFAEYCVVPEADLYDVTDAPLSDVELAAIPCAFGTAAGLLDRAGVAAGQNVLITGASGGVGLATVQLAAQIGAGVTGVASPAKADCVRDAGANEVLSRGDVPPVDFFHAVIDLVAGPGWPALIDALRPGGHYAVAGAIAGPMVEADLRRIYLRDITIHGCTYQPPRVFAALVDKVNAGQVRPLIAKTYPLQEIALAQEEFMAKRHAGKLVLLPPGAGGPQGG